MKTCFLVNEAVGGVGGIVFSCVWSAKRKKDITFNRV